MANKSILLERIQIISVLHPHREVFHDLLTQMPTMSEFLLIQFYEVLFNEVQEYMALLMKHEKSKNDFLNFLQNLLRDTAKKTFGTSEIGNKQQEKQVLSSLLKTL